MEIKCLYPQFPNNKYFGENKLIFIKPYKDVCCLNKNCVNMGISETENTA